MLAFTSGSFLLHLERCNAVINTCRVGASHGDGLRAQCRRCVRGNICRQYKLYQRKCGELEGWKAF